MGEQTYWNHEGKYQELSEKIEKLIPASGECEDPNLEMFRLVSNAYYDCYNNGACNCHRFEELRDRLIKTANLPFTPEEWKVFKDWLSDAAAEDREFYMFSNWGNLSECDRQILEFFERLADWVALNAVKCLPLGELKEMAMVREIPHYSQMTRSQLAPLVRESVRLAPTLDQL